jgi:hypothetical protein
MIIVWWWTFRFWAIKATDMHGMGSSPTREKVNICTDLNLSKETSHITNVNKLLPFIYITSLAPPASSNIMNCNSHVSLLSVQCKKNYK